MSSLSFRDLEHRHATLEQKKDLLVHLNRLVPWEEFQPLLRQVHDKPRKSPAGRKAKPVLLMFKLLILQKLYNISDEELEYQVNDRLSFMRFLGLGLNDKVPDATTVWFFREQLRIQGLIVPLFEQFEGYLRTHGYAAKGGQIVDATLIPVPKQRNSHEENEQIKRGEPPEAWKNKPHQCAQKDTEARWTKKHGVSHFGYKDHISTDVEYGLIRRFAITDASVHDSQMLGQILDGENEGDGVWGDSAYRSDAIEAALRLLKFDSHIHERAYRNRPLTDPQKEDNRGRSKIRARIEHVFGGWVMTMGGKALRSIGLERARTHLGLTNLAYNLKRFVFWQVKSVSMP